MLGRCYYSLFATLQSLISGVSTLIHMILITSLTVFLLLQSKILRVNPNHTCANSDYLTLTPTLKSCTIQTVPIPIILHLPIQSIHNNNNLRVNPNHLSIWLQRRARADQFSANESLFILFFNVNKINSSIMTFQMCTSISSTYRSVG